MRTCSASQTRFLCLGFLCALVLVPGCHRSYYRFQADEEAYTTIRQKASNPHWNLPNYTINVDPQSRMFDPFDPDQEPMPPDDPSSHRLMHYVDGKRGYPKWHANGDTHSAENPDWWSYLPLNEDCVLELDAATAVRLSLIHSRDYQEQLEELYLSALDVSAERFIFDHQFFGGYDLSFKADGPDRPGGGGSSSSELTGEFSGSVPRGRPVSGPGAPSQSSVGVRKLFTTGSEMVVGFANSLIWEFSGPNTESASTILDFTFIQPLLRRAGRDRVMETLTLSERTLLGNVRQLERYRRGFYLSILTGDDSVPGPQRRGGIFGGSGFAGFSGVGGGGFGGLGGGGGGFGGGFGGSGAGAEDAGGFIGLLQTQLEIRNQEDNLLRLRDNLLRLQTTLQEMLTTIPEDQEAIPRQRLQVAQAQQALFNAESRLLNTRSGYRAGLDRFKMLLGLPPKLPVEISDSMLDQFNLFDEQIKSRRDEVDRLRERVGNINLQLLAQGTVVEDPATNVQQRALQWNDQVEEKLTAIKREFEGAKEIAESLVDVNAPSVAEDIEEFADALPRRGDQAKHLVEQYEQQRDAPFELLPMPMFDPAVFDVDSLEDLPEDLREGLDRLIDEFKQYSGRAKVVIENIEKIIADAKQSDEAMRPSPTELFKRVGDDVIVSSQQILTTMADDLLGFQLIQARARIESIELVPISISQVEAVKIARSYRRDWMNARANLVDRWRLIEFNADNLESDLDLVFHGDLQNKSDNPLDIRGSTGRIRVGVQFDAPFTRLLERNTYRQSLIEYQQARRSYYAFEDSVWSGMRNILRTVKRNQVNFELQRYAVRIAAEQIDLNEDIRKIRDTAGQVTGPTAARDTISALSDLLNAQNDFLSIWVNYEVIRRRLDLDLGTMQLDPEGNWIDPGPIGGKYGIPLPPLDCYPLPFDQESRQSIRETNEEPELIEPGGATPIELEVQPNDN